MDKGSISSEKIMVATQPTPKSEDAADHTAKMTVILEVKNLNSFYGSNHVIKDLNIKIFKNQITALIGPSGCGKSTFIRTLNRMNDLITGYHFTGEIILNKRRIYDKSIDPVEVRLSVGMVFQKPNPFPKTVYKNIIFGPRMLGIHSRSELDDMVEKSLRRAALWDEVKDHLHESALNLSGGQQQRLCIARALAMEPEVLLLDEPCSALDPIATGHIEELLLELKSTCSLIIVTHNMQQASRISDYCGLMWLGELIEEGPTKDIFTNPKDKRTEDYVTGRLG